MFGFFKKNQVEKEVPVFALAGRRNCSNYTSE